nr:hypothetical protein [uncultured Sphingobacterium sp.]
MNWQIFIKWTNDNSGFLSLILFVVTILFGWISGFFNSIIKKPKLKVRFIEKASFYCFFETGNQYYHPELKENFDLHQTGFAVYMSIANIGNIPTSIDKIYIGYYRNFLKKKLFDKQIIWLAQWHTFDNFKFEYQDNILLIPPLRVRNEYFKDQNNDSLEVGKSIVGVAYFEQQEAWGNYNPKTIDSDGKIKIIIRVRDIYGRNYSFKTTLKPKTLDEARKINSTFGDSSNIMRN